MTYTEDYLDGMSQICQAIQPEQIENIVEGLIRCRQQSGRIFCIGVGGGTTHVSANIVNGVSYAKSLRAKIYGIVGMDGGYTKKFGDEVIVIPTIYNHLITAYTESMQMVILHAIVFHPKLIVNEGKWESINEH